MDDVLTILDEHYNNVKLLDALDQELFQLWMADKETKSDWGIHLSRHLQVLSASFPDHFSPRSCDGAEEGLLLWQTSQAIDGNGSLPEDGTHVRTYSDYLRAAREAEKEDLIELPQSSRTQTADGLPNQGLLASSPLRKLKGNQPLLKKPAVCLAHLEEEDVDDGKDPESDDPGGIEGVMEEFMVWLAKAVKDTQADEKCCYHCSSPEHFFCNCLIVKTSRDKKQLNGKEGMASMKGAQTPLTTMSAMKGPQMETPEVLKPSHQLPSWIRTLSSNGMGSKT